MVHIRNIMLSVSYTDEGSWVNGEPEKAINHADVHTLLSTHSCKSSDPSGVEI